MSELLGGNVKEIEPKVCEKTEKDPEISNFEVAFSDSKTDTTTCTCHKHNVKLSQSEEIGQLVTKLLEGRKSGKATIKIRNRFP